MKKHAQCVFVCVSCAGVNDVMFSPYNADEAALIFAANNPVPLAPAIAVAPLDAPDPTAANPLNRHVPPAGERTCVNCVNNGVVGLQGANAMMILWEDYAKEFLTRTGIGIDLTVRTLPLTFPYCER